MSEHLQGYRIVIVGGGIGGLCAAIALARDGHRVIVLEQAPEPKPIGAGISLQPNALACLDRLDIADAVIKKAATTSAGEICRENGRIIRKLDFSNYKSRFGYLPCTIARSDLFDALYAAAVDAGASVRFGQRVDSFEEQGDQVNLTTQSESYHCNLLIGADGLHSQVRTILFGEQPTRYSGYLCWRGIASTPSVVRSVTSMREYWGTHARFGCMRCNQNHVYWYATLDQDNPDVVPEGWRSVFSTWHSRVIEIIDATDPDRIHATPIADRPPSGPWHRGPVALLGDAAHPMTPNLGQGGAQAMEDAVVLASAIRNHQDIGSAFAAYHSHRFARTTQITNSAKLIGRIGQGGTWWKRWVRNGLIGRLPNSMMEKSLAKQFLVEDHLKAFDV